jgi:hypothetical protein
MRRLEFRCAIGQIAGPDVCRLALVLPRRAFYDSPRF